MSTKYNPKTKPTEGSLFTGDIMIGLCMVDKLTFHEGKLYYWAFRFSYDIDGNRIYFSANGGPAMGIGIISDDSLVFMQSIFVRSRN